MINLCVCHVCQIVRLLQRKRGVIKPKQCELFGLGQSSRALKVASVEMLTKNALFIPYIASIQTNIWKFCTLEEAIEFI